MTERSVKIKYCISNVKFFWEKFLDRGMGVRRLIVSLIRLYCYLENL
jgi:hypothetical protein